MWVASFLCSTLKDVLIAINWGTSLIRLVYPIAKLVESSISSTLRDRKSRLFYLQLLDECMKLFQQMDEKARSAYARSKRTKIPSHMPDSIACANISLQTMMIMLPLPDWIFNTAVYPLLNIVTERTGLNSVILHVVNLTKFENAFYIYRDTTINIQVRTSKTNTVESWVWVNVKSTHCLQWPY